MTTYILAGGKDLRFEAYGERLAKEVYEYGPRPTRLLSCFFATPPEYWNVKAKTWQPWFARYFGRDVEWSYAQPNDFTAQLKETDVVYLHGGDNELLRGSLVRFPELQAHFDGKVVIASSAAANYLSQHFWRRCEQKIGRGKGIVPYSVMVHYGVSEQGTPDTDWDGVAAELAAFDGEEPLRLMEGNFKVINI